MFIFASCSAIVVLLSLVLIYLLLYLILTRLARLAYALTRWYSPSRLIILSCYLHRFIRLISISFLDVYDFLTWRHEWLILLQVCCLFKGISLDLVDRELAVLVWLVRSIFLLIVVNFPACFDLLETRLSEGLNSSSSYANRVSRLYKLPHLMEVLV